MSDTLWVSEEGFVVVSRYCGPAGPPDRRLWQISVVDDRNGSTRAVASLGRTEIEELLATVRADVDRRGVST